MLWSDYYGAALFGDRQEIACIPHTECRLEIVATAETSHRGVNLLLPGQVLQYRYSRFLPDRLTLPSGAKAWLGHFVGFKLQLAPNVTSPPPREEDLVRLGKATTVRSRMAPTGRSGAGLTSTRRPSDAEENEW
jgi:hypothetical protein